MVASPALVLAGGFGADGRGVLADELPVLAKQREQLPLVALRVLGVQVGRGPVQAVEEAERLAHASAVGGSISR
jgi:hypothetical protein